MQECFPQEEYQDLQVVSDAKEKAGEALYDLRFKKGKLNGLTGGNLKNTGNWTGSDETALRIFMEKPQPMYLRGFVGSRYDGSSWKSIDPSSAYQERNLFYWLHQKGFYGETQLASGARLTDTSISSQKISVKNLAADSRYLYTSYEMQQLPEGCQGEDGLADSTVGAKGFWGQRNYSFTTVQPLTSQFTDLGAQISSFLLQGKIRDTDRRKAIIMLLFTPMTCSCQKLLKVYLSRNWERQETEIRDIRITIQPLPGCRAYLEKHMTYSSAADPYSKSGDFVREFLEDKKIGHSVHFATAAALMLPILWHSFQVCGRISGHSF